MPELSITQFGGINSYVNPIIPQQNGQVIHCLNLDDNPYGSKVKRSGYNTFLGTPDSGTVNSLFSWMKNDGTTLYLYRASGSKVYYSAQGTGDWTVCGNGTINNGSHVGHAVLEDSLMIGDGVGSTRHTANGTSFTDTTAAPLASDFEQYQGRMWAMGTASNLFYSTVGTITDWTTDSSSILIPGAGKLLKIFKSADRLISMKNSRAMFRYDGNTLVDMATKLGPDSPYSVGDVEDMRFWINSLGVFLSGGGKPQLISNAVQNQIYNITSTNFATIPAEVHKYDYYAAIGTVTDPLVGDTINDAILVYDFKHNDFSNYQFAHPPTAFHSYLDTSGSTQMIFGNASGQCYQLSGTATSDAGSAITSSMQLVIHAGAPFLDKEWGYLEVFTNPGCEAKIQVAFEKTFIAGQKKWVEIGDLKEGFNQFRFPTGSRGRLCFLRIYEASTDTPFSLYGTNYTFNLINR